jgi:hypothetical protein
MRLINDTKFYFLQFPSRFYVTAIYLLLYYLCANCMVYVTYSIAYGSKNYRNFSH